jgi:hypothetical protein
MTAAASKVADAGGKMHTNYLALVTGIGDVACLGPLAGVVQRSVRH